MSPSPENAAPAKHPAAASAPARQEAEYSPQERALLLRLAHQTIAAALRGEVAAHGEHRPMDTTPPAPSPHLAEKRGAFVTLHRAGQLRGCVGFVQPARGLYSTIIEAALAAAFHDPRFPPVTEEEATDLQVEISVLSPLRPIAPQEVVVGRHGLVVSRGSRRGLLLPQVAVEQQWDAAIFLEQTCLKAGLPPDAWKQGATLQAFTAEVFGDS